MTKTVPSANNPVDPLAGKKTTEPSDSLKAAIAAIKRGEMVILVDSEDRENEGDLVLAAQFTTGDKVNFLIREACGLVCLTLEPQKVDQLGLPPMVQENRTSRKTAFTVSIEAAQGVSTGISPQDRAHTILVAVQPTASAKDLVSPGHVFPLRAVAGGVLERAGHTEGSIELCKLAGLIPAAVICEIINADGSMARKNDLEAFGKKHKIPICTIEDIIKYRSLTENWIRPTSVADFPTRYSTNSKAKWVIRGFENTLTHQEHAAISTETRGAVPLVRIHSECLTGDALGSLRCDCGEQLRGSIQMISEDEAGGVVVYLKDQEGRGIGLWNKIESYSLQDQGKDTVDANLALGFQADERHYHEAAKILLSMGIHKIRLITNNPHKVQELQKFGIEIVETVLLQTEVNSHNQKYLETKQERFHHSLNLDNLNP
jgi:3,4-dihydroxy 2-butanone 4-phosphate synthase/GTP cyclohydrolase II